MLVITRGYLSHQKTPSRHIWSHLCEPHFAEPPQSLALRQTRRDVVDRWGPVATVLDWKLRYQNNIAVEIHGFPLETIYVGSGFRIAMQVCWRVYGLVGRSS